MKAAATLFAILIIALLGVVVWDALGKDPGEACREGCRAKSAGFESAGEFRQCVDRCGR